MIATLALALSLTVGPQASQPSFDCRRASTPTEHAICADPALGRMDRQMAERYGALRRALPPMAREALTRDQRRFIGARDEWQENSTRGGFRDFGDLGERMRGRIQLLGMMRTRPERRLAGGWSNAAGTVQLTPAGDGTVRVDFSAAHPVNARWLCEVAGQAKPVNGVLTIDGTEGWEIRIRLRDGYLQVEEIEPRSGEGGVRPYCGANGYLEGAYFGVDPK